MGLFSWFRSLLGEKQKEGVSHAHTKVTSKPVFLHPLRYQSRVFPDNGRLTSKSPYSMAYRNPDTGEYRDLTGDTDLSILSRYKLPTFSTPEEIANWLDIQLGQLAWLTHRFHEQNRPDRLEQAHYHLRWIKKRAGGLRLIESPKRLLRQAQHQILLEILNQIPVHHAAHGFKKGCSILTNAAPHVNSRVVVKLDLENFYAGITFSRIVAIFRRIGYCRESSIWLARLTTSSLPRMMPFPSEGTADSLSPYFSRHLPQGAPTSPSLANLSAFALDVRCSGLAKSFGGRYTRYADDLTFSGDEQFLNSLSLFIPLVKKIIYGERFRVNHRKQKVIRSNQRQVITGVVVNERTNVSRVEFDRLKATLHNCIRYGAGSQNRNQHSDFKSYLRGKIAHIKQLNRQRGEKLEKMFQEINW